jgi:hypothetical protein
MDEKMVLLEGKSAKLKNDFIHHDRKGLSAWTRKHEGYAARQARVLLQSNYAGEQANDHDRKGLSAWTRKHEGYAARQARVLLQSNYAGEQANDIQPRLLGGQAERKRWLKYYVYARVPLFWRAFLFFAYRYFFRLGFLDGTPGLVFHFLHACWYMFYIDSRIYEYTWREADQRLYLRGEARN